MLIHAHAGLARAVRGHSHIVLCLDQAGEVIGMEVFDAGALDSTYGAVADARLLDREIPQALGELRQQAQSRLSGST